MKARGSRPRTSVKGSSRLEHCSVDVRRHSRIKFASIEACIGEARIPPQRVDACLRNTDGRRHNVNICLVDDMVPDRNIRMLNDCVDADEHSRNY